MSENDDQANHTVPAKRRAAPGALDVGGRKRVMRSDPLIHRGRHFGRIVHVFCNIHVLLTNGLARSMDPNYKMDDPELPPDEQRENRLFLSLLENIPSIEDRISEGCSEEELRVVTDLIQRGINGARADDTKTLKGAVLDWLTPRGVPLNPPLTRNIKTDRGFHHEATGKLLCPANLDWQDPEVKRRLQNGDYILDGEQWPIFLYKDYKYDPENPWNGLLRSEILISAYKHIFTCPSSAQNQEKTARSGNAQIHGMKRATIPSLAYAATQLRFSLSSSPAFSRNDKSTDSQRFYNSIIEFLEDEDEVEEVSSLVAFWNREVFPEHLAGKRPLLKNSVLSRLKEKRAALKELNAARTIARLGHTTR